ncbi:single-stranded-DNA-specific exonuclease RecJ [Salipaludibacillus sp. CF4.18]|uniref:single-stranded-DNA-specific exonuclease RecJ n=1 Tax=Salipaludibacillus sp. CF4.18 TaxID=3373081 RepID=UPI003EE57F1B
MREWKKTTIQTIQDEHLIHYLARQFNIDPIVMKVLCAKGLKNEEVISEFFYPSIENLHDPFLLNDMRKAVCRIIQGMKRKEKIMIFGDYDADGITSSVVLYRGLRFFGANVNVQLPLRSEGYGLSAEAVKRLSHDGVTLLITVDNGTSAHEAMEQAKQEGIEVIVTDHHEVLGKHPTCHAFINPKRSDNTYPFPHLAGVGVAFKVVHALFLAAKLNWEKHLWKFIELTALGTVADMMPLIGENRIMAKSGIYKMDTGPEPMLKKLFHCLKLSRIDSTTLSFQIAPILNSCGRIDNPNVAAQLFIQENTKTVEIYALIELNKKRKAMVEEQFMKADSMVKDHYLFLDELIVVWGDFHEGLIGILAARITENYHKPAIVISLNGKGSARSVQNSEFSIVNTIQRCSTYLKSYGGHQAAAGLNIDMDKVRKFSIAIQLSAVKETLIKSIINYEHQFSIARFPKNLFDDLAILEPFGMGNPMPIFHSGEISIKDYRTFGRYHDHVSFTIGKKEAIAFRQASQFQSFHGNLEFLYTPNLNETSKFLVCDLRSV